jgi:MSHA pilin protein MshA
MADSASTGNSLPFSKFVRFVSLEIDMSKASQGGFTLIELVVVIVILGVLAAFAVPRFMGLEKQARVATLNGLAGSVRSAAALAHSLQLASGGGANDPITITGVADPVPMSNGYPELDGLQMTLEEYPGFGYEPTTGVFAKEGANDPDTCSVTYAESTAIGSPPQVTIDKSGC